MSEPMTGPLVSIIVPVYMVERYLEKCVKSIMAQTYDNLEIILIDDGSTDESGAICDSMMEHDKRFVALHQANAGLSAVRNKGIAISRGKYLLFVDGDDWLEPFAVERLLEVAIRTDADVVCSGYYLDNSQKSRACIITDHELAYEDEQILVALIDRAFANVVWNKLWRKELFDENSFPADRNFEDIATVWRIFSKCRKVVCIDDTLMHYTNRVDSISNTKSLRNIVDRWLAFKERFDGLAWKNEWFYRNCARDCLDTIGYTWRWLYKTEKAEQEEMEQYLNDMISFAKSNRKYTKYCSPSTRFCVFCAIHSNAKTVKMCYYLNQIYRRIVGKNQVIR